MNESRYRRGVGQPSSRIGASESCGKGLLREEPKQNAPRLNRVAQGRLLRGIFDYFAIAFLRRFHSLKGSLDRNQFLTEDTDSIKKALKRVFMHCVFFEHDDTLSRKQAFSPLVFDLNSIVRETGRMLPRVIGEHIEIAVVLSVGRAPVLADPTQVQQILMNLAANARDAMPEGGKLTIEVANCEMKLGGGELADLAPGHYVTLTVSDTGAGMSPEIQSRAFDPFFTTKEIGKGTGLGLSTVYGVVKESRGSILIKSLSEEGTTFRIYLPWAMEEIISLGAASRVPDESLRGSETILLVEDQSELRNLIHEYLQGLGYRVLDAGVPGQAIQIARRFTQEIDLLLTDVVMPSMNGRALAQQLRPLYAKMRVLYVSGFTDQTLEQDVRDPNNAFLPKPFLLRELATKIRELFREPKLCVLPEGTLE
jgi:two-component system cell cycle sensor histidine kinase/response regulator CckA